MFVGQRKLLSFTSGHYKQQSYSIHRKERLEDKISYLHVEGKPVFLEGVEVKNQLLPTFGERRQVAVAVHMDGLALQDLQMNTEHRSSIMDTLMCLKYNFIAERGQAPRCLCSAPPPRSSPAAPASCPPCRPSCRSSAAGPRWRRSSWRTPQTWPGTARRSAPGITETLDSPSQESGDSLRARTWRRRDQGGEEKRNTCGRQPGTQLSIMRMMEAAFVSHVQWGPVKRLRC